MIHKTTKTILRTFAFAFALCATTSAWAVTANVVWESDFGTTVKTGLDGKTYTLSLPDASWLQGNGTIKIGSNDNSQGATIVVTGGVQGEKVSILMEYADATAQSAVVPVYVAAGAWLGSQTKDSSLEVTGHWWNDGGAAYPKSGDTVTTMPEDGYFMYIFAQGDNVEIYSAETLAGMSDASAGGAVSGLNTANRVVSQIALGGVMIGGNGASLTSRPVNEFTGLVIKRVAIFTSKISASEAAAYKFPSELTKATVTAANTSWSTAFPSWDDNADNSDKSIWLEIQEGASLSKDTALSVNNLVVTGAGSLTLSGAVTASGGIVVGKGATVTISGGTGSAITNNGTLNVHGSTISGAITNNGTLNTDGTVSLSSTSNIFESNSKLDVKTGTTTLVSGDRRLKGALHVQEKAQLISTSWDAINYSGTVRVYVHGILTINSKWTLGESNYITLYSGAVIDGSADPALHWNSGTPNGVRITAEGNAEIKAKVSVSGSRTIGIDVKEAATLTFSTSSWGDVGTFAKSGNGTLELKNKPLTFKITGSEGTVRLLNTTGTHLTHTATGVSFSGTLDFACTGDHAHIITSSTFLASGAEPQLAINTTGSGAYADSYAHLFFAKENPDNPTLAIRDLIGEGTANAKASGKTAQTQTIRTKQTQNTTFNGNLMCNDGTGEEPHKINLNVIGDGSGTTHSLTLAAANTSIGTLTVSDEAKVVFGSNGSWASGTVVVDDDGILESQNSAAIAKNLKIQEGATLKFANGVQLAATDYDWTSVTTDGSVNIDLSEIAPSFTPVTLIASGVTVTKDKFTVAASQTPATLSVEGEALKATFANVWRDGAWSGSVVADDDATLYISQNSTLTVPEALALGTVTVVKEGEGNVELTISGAGALTTAGWTIPQGVTVNTPATMSISGTISGDGVLNIPADSTLAMNGVSCAPDIIVQSGGALNASGTTSLGKTLTIAGDFTVVSGTTTVDGAFWAQEGSRMSVIGTLSINDCGVNPIFDSTVNVAGIIYVLGYYTNALINGEINVTGSFVVQSETTVSATGSVIVSSGGLFAVNYGTENSGVIQLPGISSYQCAAGGTLEINNSDSGVVILTSNENINNDSSDYSFLKGTGTLKFVNANGYWVWPNAESKQFASTLSVVNEVANGICVSYGTADANNPAITAFRNLSGAGSFRSDWNSNYPRRKLRITQTKNTKWSGQFIAGNRIDGVEVFGSGTTKTLELAGTACQDVNRTPPLTIDSTGSVNLSVEWRGDVTANGEFGGIGSVIGALNMNNGSTFKAFASDTDGLSVSSTTIFANGAGDNVNIDVSDIVTDITNSGITLISSTGTLTVDVDKLTVTSGYFCRKENNTLKVYPVAATVTKSDDSVVAFETVQAAVDASATSDYSGYKYVTIWENTSFIPVVGVKYKIADGVSATPISGSPEYAFVANDADANGAVTYKKENNPTTYTWKADAATNYWQVKTNWKNSAEETADRAVTSSDSVVINVDRSSNPIQITSHTTINAISVGNTVTLAALNTDKTLTVTESVVLTTETSTLTISGTLSLSGTVTTTVADKCVKWVYGESSKTYSVADPVAEIGGVKYGSLANAIEIATDADLASITVTTATAEVPEGYYLVNNNTGIAKYQAAIVDGSAGVHYYTTVDAAISDIDSYLFSPFYDHFEVYYGTDIAVDVDASAQAWGGYSVKIKCLNGSSVAVASTAAEYDLVAGEPVEGIVTYTREEKATTYVWAGGEGSTAISWHNPNKWKIGTAEGATAKRAPSAKDTVVLNGGAPITIANNAITVFAISVGGAADIRSITGGTLTATSSIVLTDASASIAIPEGALSPVPTTSVEGKGVTWSTVDGTTTYSVANAVAQIGDNKYGSLALAIAAASDNATITLVSDCSEAVNLGGKTITLDEGSYTFSGSFTGSGTLALTALLKSAATARWAAGWTGTVVLPANLTLNGLNFDNYGRTGSTVQLQGTNTGWLQYRSNNDPIATTVEIPSGASLTVTGWSPSFANAFDVLKGSGTFAVSPDSANASGDSSYTAYFLLKNVSNFTGSLSATRAGIAIGDTRIANTVAGGKIIVSAGKTPTIASGATWQAAEGFTVDGTLTCSKGGKIYGTGAEGTLALDGSGVIVNEFEGGSAQCFNAGAITVSGSLQVKMVGGWSNFGTWTLTDTASLGFDPGTDNDIWLNSTITAAPKTTTINIYGNGTKPVVDNDADGTKDAAIHVHNGGTFQVSTKAADNDRLKWDSRNDVGGITVDAGGKILFKSRETYTRNTTLAGGTFTLDGIQSDRSFDIYDSIDVNVTEDSIIEATGSSHWIYLRSGTPTFTVAENKTLTVNASFDKTGGYQSLNKAGSGTMIVNGYVDGSGNHESFSQPKGVIINAGTYELNAVQTSNGQTGADANFYTVASGAKLKIGATGQANMTTLNLVDGSLLEFGASNATLINANAVTFTSGAVAVSLSGGVTPANGTKLIGWTTAPTGGTFTLEGCPQYRVVAESDGLYLMKKPGTLFSVY